MPASISFCPSTSSWICSVKFSFVCLTASLIFSKTVGSFFFGGPNRVMNSIGYFSFHQVVDRNLGRESLVQNCMHLFDNGHFDIVLAGEGHCRACRLYPFGDH